MTSAAENAADGPLEPKHQPLLKSSVVMASGTLISRLLGFARSALLVAAIGVTAGTAASFQLANTLPNMVYNLLAAGIIDAVLIPQIVRALKTRSGSAYVNKLITAAGTLLFLLTVLAMVATPLIITILAPSLPPAMRALTITFALICVPQIFFYGVYNLLGELLNARGIFGPYMWAPVVNNVIGIISLVVFLYIWGPSGEVLPAEDFGGDQILVLAGTATLGVIVQAAVLLIPMRKAGVNLRLDFRFIGTDFGSASKVAGWTFATLMVSQIGVVSTTNLATRADTWTDLTGQVVAGIQSYQYAFMIFMVPQSLIAVTLATAIFTRLANDVSDKNYEGVAWNYQRGVEIILMLSFFSSAVLAVGSIPVMQMIMPTFGTAAASLYGDVLVALILGLPSVGLVLMSQRVFFAFEDAKPVFLIGIVPAVVQVIVGWTIYFLTSAEWWTIGAAAAETANRVTQGFIAVIWVGYFVRQINVRKILGSYFRNLLAFTVSALVGWGVMHFITPGSDSPSLVGRFSESAMKLVVVTLVIFVVYFGFLRLIDPVGFKTVFGSLMARIRPGSVAAAESPSAADAAVDADSVGDGDAEADEEATSDEHLAKEGSSAQPPLPPGLEIRGESSDHRSIDQIPLDEDGSSARSDATDGDSGGIKEPVFAANWRATPPIWEEIFAGESAGRALSRSFSASERSQTGAIPVLSGMIPMLRPTEDGELEVTESRTAFIEPVGGTTGPPAPDPEADTPTEPPAPPAGDHDEPPTEGSAFAATGALDTDDFWPKPGLSEQDDSDQKLTHADQQSSLGAVEVGKKVVLESQSRSTGAAATQKSSPTKQPGRFDPTVPSLIVGLLIVVFGVWFAVQNLFPTAEEDSAGLQSQSAEQSGQSEIEPEEEPAETASGPAPVIQGGTVFSWSNDEGDHPELVGALFDGDPATVWRSRYYDQNLFSEGNEIAILLNLEQPAVVSEITVDILGTGGELIVRNVVDGNPRAGEILASVPITEQTVIKLPQPTEAASLGLVFKTLPTDDEGLIRAKVTNITVK